MFKKKNGQARMTETIAILFIFFILILFGIIFYSKYQQVSLKEKQEELLAARAMDTTLRTLFMPEIMCTKGNAEPEDNCFDLMKLRHVGSIFTENLNKYYFNIFSYAKITVHEIYPGNNTYLLYNKEKTKELEDGTIVKNWQKKEPTYFIVTLRDEINEEGRPHYGYGYIKVEVYS